MVITNILKINYMKELLKQQSSHITSLSTSCSEPLNSDDGVRNLCCSTSSVNEKEFIDFSRKNVKLNERSACSLDLCFFASRQRK